MPESRIPSRPLRSAPRMQPPRLPRHWGRASALESLPPANIPAGSMRRPSLAGDVVHDALAPEKVSLGNGGAPHRRPDSSRRRPASESRRDRTGRSDRSARSGTWRAAARGIARDSQGARRRRDRECLAERLPAQGSEIDHGRVLPEKACTSRRPCAAAQIMPASFTHVPGSTSRQRPRSWIAPLAANERVPLSHRRPPLASVPTTSPSRRRHRRRDPDGSAFRGAGRPTEDARLGFPTS